MHMEAWGGGLIVVFAVLLWIAYFVPWAPRRNDVFSSPSFIERDVAPINVRAAKNELKLLRAREKEAYRKFVNCRAEFSGHQFTGQLNSKKFFFRRAVFITLCFSCLPIVLGIAMGNWVLFTTFLLVLLVSTLLALRIVYIAAKARMRSAQQKPERPTRALPISSEEPSFQKAWRPSKLPKPIYLLGKTTTTYREYQQHRIDEIKKQMQDEFSERIRNAAISNGMSSLHIASSSDLEGLAGRKKIDPHAVFRDRCATRVS